MRTEGAYLLAGGSSGTSGIPGVGALHRALAGSRDSLADWWLVEVDGVRCVVVTVDNLQRNCPDTPGRFGVASAQRVPRFLDASGAIEAVRRVVREGAGEDEDGRAVSPSQDKTWAQRCAGPFCAPNL